MFDYNLYNVVYNSQYVETIINVLRGFIGITLSVCPSVRLSICPSVNLYLCKCSFFLMDKQILMKLYTVAVYDLRMCMKERNHGQNYFKGDS